MKKLLNLGTAIKLICAGFAGGALLRLVQMLYFFDEETELFENGGLFSWLSFTWIILTLAGAWAIIIKLKGAFESYASKRGVLLGIAALLSGIALLALGAVELNTGFTVEARFSQGAGVQGQSGIRTVFDIMSVIFGIVQIFLGFSLLSGKNPLSRLPLLYLVGVAWGAVYLVMVYVLYTVSPYFVENFLTVIGAASLLLALLYLCKLFAGVSPAVSAQRFFITGGTAVVLLLTRSLSGLIMRGFVIRYSGEMPLLLEISNLFMGVFLLSFLGSFRREVILSPIESSHAEHFSKKGNGERRRQRH